MSARQAFPGHCSLVACAVSVVCVSGLPSPAALAAQKLESQRALADFFALRLDTDKDGTCTRQEYQTYMQWMDPEVTTTHTAESVASRR